MKLTTKIDGPVAVIGDVHGQTEKLAMIMEKLLHTPNAKQRWIVFMGDLVDRGPDSRGTIDLICELMSHGYKVTSICGNHDYAMAASLNFNVTPYQADWATRWMDHYDSESTFESYGVGPKQLRDLAHAVPTQHRQLLTDMPWCVEHPQYLFVHAGLDPFMPMDIQLKILRQKDYSLNRPQWMYDKKLVHSDLPNDCKLTVVSGHVCVPEVVMTRQRILCDTTGGIQGDLSCVLLPERKVIISGTTQTAKAQTASTSEKSWWKIW
jgi:serine/threonine protein phosphatase 1